MKKRFLITDIHGAYEAFKQCLQKSGFNPEVDELFVNGDIVDAWPQTKECVDLLLSLKNFTFVMGNHDMWFLDYIKSNGKIAIASGVWLEHGGMATIKSYKDGIPDSHKNLFLEAKYYYVTSDYKLIIHAGFKPGVPLNPINYVSYCMNRDLVNSAIKAINNKQDFNIPDFTEVFVGHSPTINYIKEPIPIRAGNFYMLDTGAAFNGVLTIMDIDSKQYWSSDPVMMLYPNDRGRNQLTYNESKIKKI